MYKLMKYSKSNRAGRRGRNRMVVRFITNNIVCSNPAHGEV